MATERYAQQQQTAPLSHQVMKAATAATFGGSLLLLCGITLTGTVVALTLATPLLVIFSPVLVPAVITMFKLGSGFVVSGGLGVAALSVVSWMYRYLTGKHPMGADQLETGNTASFIAFEAVDQGLLLVSIAMSALADSSPPPKMPGKRIFENGGSNGYRTSGFKHRKVDSVRKYPEKCGAAFSAGVNTPSNNCPSNFKRGNVGAVRKFPVNCGATFSACVDSLSNGNIESSKEDVDLLEPNERCAMPIAAVPLRSIPLIGVGRDPGHSCPLDSNEDGDDGKKTGNEDGDDGKKTAKDNVIKSLVDDMEKLAKAMAEAKDLLKDIAIRYSQCGERNTELVSIDLDEWASVGKTEQKSDSNSDVVDCNINVKAGVTYNIDPKYYDENQKDLINLRIVRHEELQGLKVAETLKVFKDYYDEIIKEHEKRKPRVENKIVHAHLEAAKRLKKEGKYIIHEKLFGHIPGVEIGDEFRFRSQLAVVGLHRQLISGIDHVSLCGKKYATSVVDSGRYENTATTHDVLIYSGQGGNLNIVDKVVDQKLEKGNLALMNSKEMGYPIRVTFKQKSLEGDNNGVYVYDGLYMVNNAWQVRDSVGKLVFKFELHRMPDQMRSRKILDVGVKKVETRREEGCMVNDISRGKEKVLISEMNNVDGNRKTNVVSKMVESRMKEVFIVNDVSLGKEKFPIHAMNGVDDNWPPTFIYVTRMVYPSWYRKIEPTGCDCVDGCSDSHQCTCVVKNGGEIPYNENGSIIKATARVHECGSLCKCPPTCMNRVSQFGPRYQLEIFNAGQKGWGVRSRDLIPSGGFVCEYIGEFLREKEADLRIGGDEYLFDICKGTGGCGNGYSIDAAVYGNIGRFFNHSCSPNMYAQKVIYDHDDHRMPHIMFFATEDIPPLKEITYHYNYKLGTVCDADWNVKTKDCFCGSRKCSKRLY